MFLSFGRHFDLGNGTNDVIALVVVENYLIRIIHVQFEPNHAINAWGNTENADRAFPVILTSIITSVTCKCLDILIRVEGDCIPKAVSQVWWQSAQVHPNYRRKYTRAGVTSPPNLSIDHYEGGMKREQWILKSNPKNPPEPTASEWKIQLAT